MRSLRDTAQQWLAARRSAVLVEVADARGSVPREAGTRMLVSVDDLAGTIGGGHLEWKAIDAARRRLAGDSAAPSTEHYPLGPALGQCCGGAVTLAYSVLDGETLERWPADAWRFDLQLFGAGHVGRAIVRALMHLPVRITWIDEREEEFALAESLDTGLARVERVCVDSVDSEVAHAPPGAFYLVLTHQHDLDLRITQAVLRRGDFGYLGLIGSRTKRQRFLHRLEQLGFSAPLLGRLTCPIGIPGIVGKEPEVLAAAVTAQLLLCSSGGTALDA